MGRMCKSVKKVLPRRKYAGIRLWLKRLAAKTQCVSTMLRFYYANLSHGAFILQPEISVSYQRKKREKKLALAQHVRLRVCIVICEK